MREINRRFGARVNFEAKHRAASARAPENVVIGMERDQRQRIQRVGDLRRAANVIEVRVLAVATAGGVQLIEPKIYYSIVPTGDRIA